MIHYTDYNVDKLAALARSLNSMLISPPQKTLTTIKNKYLHEYVLNFFILMLLHFLYTFSYYYDYDKLHH